MSATIPSQRPPYIYGEILSRSAYTAETEERSDRPRFWLYVTQGATTGAVLAFVFVLIEMIRWPNVYNVLFIRGLLWILPLGLGWGTAKGLVIWACARLTGHRVAWFFRAAIAAVVSQALTRVLALIFPSEPGPPVGLSWTVGSTVFMALSYGIVIGSNLNPWRALVRGANFTVAKSVILAGVTGFLLRLTIVFMFMEALVFLIWITQINYDQQDLIWAVLILSHLTAALLVVFVRMRFWLLSILALLVTTPVVMLLVEFQYKLEWALYPIISYLVVWIAFVLTRWRPTYSALDVINEEIHYYLID